MVLLDGMIAMREASRAVLMMVLVLVVSNPVQSQSITVDGNVETDAQLVTKATDGTAPLVVSSSTKVDNLNADSLDGLDSATFAREVDFQNLRSLLFRLQSQIDNLALLPMTGQTACFDAAGSSTTCTSGVGMGQDAYFRAGMPWPNPRFVRHGNGTVTDELTGLIWLENANCFNAQGWTAALAAAKELYDGSTNDLMGGDCGLSDGSVQGQWRLPNLQELMSLLHFVLPRRAEYSGDRQVDRERPVYQPAVELLLVLYFLLPEHGESVGGGHVGRYLHLLGDGLSRHVCLARSRRNLVTTAGDSPETRPLANDSPSARAQNL